MSLCSLLRYHNHKGFFSDLMFSLSQTMNDTEQVYQNIYHKGATSNAPCVICEAPKPDDFKNKAYKKVEAATVSSFRLIPNSKGTQRQQKFVEEKSDAISCGRYPALAVSYKRLLKESGYHQLPAAKVSLNFFFLSG